MTQKSWKRGCTWFIISTINNTALWCAAVASSYTYFLLMLIPHSEMLLFFFRNILCKKIQSLLYLYKYLFQESLIEVRAESKMLHTVCNKREDEPLTWFCAVSKRIMWSWRVLCFLYWRVNLWLCAAWLKATLQTCKPASF